MKYFALILLMALLNIDGVFAQKSPFTPQDVLNVKSFGLSDITKDGKMIAGTISSRRGRMNVDHTRYRDPNYIAPSSRELVIMNTETSEQLTILPETSNIRSVQWSPSGNDLAYVVYENELFNLYIYNVSKAKARAIKLKSNAKIASNTNLLWTPDGKCLIISLRSDGWAEKGDSLFKEATAGPVTVYDSKRPFLKWEEIGNHSSLSKIAKLDVKSGDVTELMPEGRYSGFVLPESGARLIFNTVKPIKTVYDRKGGTEYGLYSVDLNNPENIDTLIKQSEKRLSLNWNSSNTGYAYVDSSRIYIRSLVSKDGIRISTDTTEIVKEDTLKAKFSFVRWSSNDKNILASSKSGYWIIDVETKDMKRVYQFPEDPETAPNLSVIHWSNDLNSLYMSYSAKDRWERGFVRFDIDKQKFTDLVKDSNLYGRPQVTKDGLRFFYSFSDGDKPNDLFTADTEFKNIKQLTNLNPWIDDRTITRSELIKYMDSDGNELYGVLYYPVNYEEGKKYPLVCEIYETFFNNGYSYSMNLVTNAGYFGFKPSVNLIEGYPGEAWIKGITSGINKLIEMGMVDGDKLGVHGTSYGGYATSLLISQTDRFAAAINISGKTDIISFLGDSPRIGTRNYAAAEVGQDRIGETLWDAPLKYIATSAIMSADRINTPHLLITGEGDWNVPAINSRELYYALRRLGKEVVWVNYYNGGHGGGNASNEADFYDHWKRMLDWYKTHFEKEESSQ